MIIFTAKRINSDKLWLLPLLIGFAIQSLLMWVEPAASAPFERIIFLSLRYFFIGLFLGTFIPLYWDKLLKTNIPKQSIKAKAYLEKLEESKYRSIKGLYESRRVKLTLRIEGHPNSPYSITDTFTLSETDLQQLSYMDPTTITVDPDDPTKVVLALKKIGPKNRGTRTDLSDKLSPATPLIILLWAFSPMYLIAMTLMYNAPANRYMGLINMLVFMAGTLLFIFMRIKRRRLVLSLIPLFLALIVHYLILRGEAAQPDFGGKLISLSFLFGFNSIMLGVLVPMFWEKIMREIIIKTGIDAVAYFESFKDCNITSYEGTKVELKYQLTMRIEGHPQSPYRITDTFYLSKAFLEKLSPDKPLPIKVDRNDRTRVVLDFK
jgi:hypothetical protein